MVTALPWAWDHTPHNGEFMPRDSRNLLDVLKVELEFLEQGGYSRLTRESWRARFFFEDSPTCLDFDSNPREPCSECLLMQFVPKDAHKKQTPCIYIPLSPAGETLESLYRIATQKEIEETLGAWLRMTIHRLEADKLKRAAPAGSSR
jgi:hypothetical protein